MLLSKEANLMGVTVEEFTSTKRQFVSLVPRMRKGNTILAFQVTLGGIVGCRNKNRINYTLMLDCRNYPSGHPTCFVLWPPEERIKHVNIYHPQYCHLLTQQKPRICIGTLEDEWHKLKSSQRTLLLYLTEVRNILNHENFLSPARMC